MLVQLQEQRGGVTVNTQGIPIWSPNPITTSEVRQTLMDLWVLYSGGAIPWAPQSIADDVRFAIVRLSIELKRFPPYGTPIVGQILGEEAGSHRGSDYRIDIENKAGWNLLE